MNQYILIFTIIFFGLYVNANGGDQVMTAQEVIKKLGLKPLPDEGGYYRENYKCKGRDLPANAYGINASTSRSVCTAIYYLVTPESFSALHKVASDEIFHFYAGDPVEMIQIDQTGVVQRFTIGSDIFNDESPQVVVQRGVWQALKLKAGGSWALMGTTVSPGFEFEDFELGDRESLKTQFPHLSNDIIEYTRELNQKAHE